MIIIVAATGAAPDLSPELEPLLSQYDRARTPGEQEQAASRVYALIAPIVKAMISRASGGRRLDAGSLDALSWEATLRGLSESGVTHLRRSDGEWEQFVQRAMRSDYPPAASVWDKLTFKLRESLKAKYLKATTVDALLRELNALLTRRDFFDPRAWSGVALSGEARQMLSKGAQNFSPSELARFNVLALASAFPEVVVPPQAKRNLLGYLSSTVLKRMLPQIWESAAGGQGLDPRSIEVYQAVKTWLDEANRMEAAGTIPAEWGSMSKAQRIYLLERADLARRYGGRVEWWNQRVRELQPEKPFAVMDKPSLRDAKELFKTRPDAVPEKLWKEPDAPYYLPAIAVSPVGVRSIERMLASAPRNEASQSAQWVASPQASQPTGQAMSIASQPQAYHMLAQHIFNGGGYDVERAVAQFLDGNPRPSPQQVEQFLQTAQPQIAETIRDVGFGNIAREIDEKIMDAMDEPETQQWLSMTLGRQPHPATASSAGRSMTVIVTPGAMRLARCANSRCA